MRPEDILKQYFGYASFRPGQEEIIDAILAGQDALAIMPTGAGKSICYQVPALLFEGVTIVISPLISLMQDQVKSLNVAGVHAAYINSSLTENQIRKTMQLAREGAFKLIYIAPERLESSAFRKFAGETDISMVTVDEAHCISQWGQDFRPGYLKIVKFIRTLRTRPVVSAFTATATPEVRGDIVRALDLRNPKEIVTSFDRPNLYFEVRNVSTQKLKEEFVMNYVREHDAQSGIIYCSTRKHVDDLFTSLFRAGVRVTRYHAGMSTEERRASQDSFVCDRSQVIVATNAFGMGIDKSNVRYVIHFNMPQSMENYYQEAGRAGRDGEPASCVLLFSRQDIIVSKMLLQSKDFSDMEPEDMREVRERDQLRLQLMEGYCRTRECLREYILEYFGERLGESAADVSTIVATAPARACCHNCGNCRQEFEQVEMLLIARQILACVAETGARYGVTVITGTLIGAKRKRLIEIGAPLFQSFGALKDMKEEVLREVISQMVLKNYLIQTPGRYSIIKPGPQAEELQKENATFLVKVQPPEEKKTASVSKSPKERPGNPLFEKLRVLRKEIAQEEHVPPYIIFSDRTLVSMCQQMPDSRETMLEVPGVGEIKYQKYGARFLEALKPAAENETSTPVPNVT